MHNVSPLKRFLNALPHGGRTQFARDIGITAVHLSQLAERRDGREPSPALSVLIEQRSGREVLRQHLRADWRAIWPELPEVEEGGVSMDSIVRLNAALRSPVKQGVIPPNSSEGSR